MSKKVKSVRIVINGKEVGTFGPTKMDPINKCSYLNDHQKQKNSLFLFGFITIALMLASIIILLVKIYARNFGN